MGQIRGKCGEYTGEMTRGRGGYGVFTGKVRGMYGVSARMMSFESRRNLREGTGNIRGRYGE